MRPKELQHLRPTIEVIGATVPEDSLNLMYREVKHLLLGRLGRGILHQARVEQHDQELSDLRDLRGPKTTGLQLQ